MHIISKNKYLTTNLKKGVQHLDDDEFLNVGVYKLEELEKMIYAGTIQDGKTIAAIMAYKNLLNKWFVKN